jgi:CheY-like chemotaxis protein
MSRLFLALESFARARGAELGVDIDFKCAGGDIKLDGAIIEAIGDSLEDVVAAAIAGSARGAAKARAELLTIHARAVLDAGVLTVEIDDDGLAEASAVQPVSIFAAYPTLARLAGVAFQPPVAAAVAADDGLARARARLGGMGGDLVRLASPVRGARIRLRLPIPDVGFVAPASFLVVEPMDSPREVVAGALTQAGFAVTAVADTDEASAAPIAGRRFAAVFVDIDLAMGGGDFLKDLRARAGPSLILTGLAAHGGPAMQALARAAGLDGAIGKFDRAGVVALARAARAPAKTEVAA